MEMSQVGSQCGLGGSMTYEEVIDEEDRQGGGSNNADADEWD